ncbi:hypothetical protein OCA5_c04950 [Afipia carboxidovorans OM5]|uniref:Uncharacterized protein n=1 Tax=Afipia carboxidovorans (strain ATCC 49405 / DSM 1227 / KCTC 32145 / OM5) TaxID=504832 RepID=F8BVU1_AFIC5|nr:hypothetical protein OCA4_c04940 [Afipia carboxidovorans OM4]AEI05219.1 hypothetical protein OCA5_c04950 [Afipia carboxidovorans OM5]
MARDRHLVACRICACALAAPLSIRGKRYHRSGICRPRSDRRRHSPLFWLILDAEQTRCSGA